MDGLLWFVAQLAVLLVLCAGVFFFLGWSIRARMAATVIRDLEARVDEEDRARRLALEERDAARRAGGDEPTKETPEFVARDWAEAQQRQRQFEREILRLNDELKAARSSSSPTLGSGVELAVESPDLRHDDLTQIKGIGAVIAKKLNAAGIVRFQQIARWTDEEVEAFSEKLAFKGRITRDRWREQARALTETA